MPFCFPCYRDLKQRLGELDALCECLEVATREIVARAEASADRTAFIDELARHHGVRVNSIDVPALRTHVERMYILTVHQSLEEFLEDLPKEHPRGRQWKLGGNSDRLNKVACAVGLKPTLAFDVCLYYRDIRNAVMHPSARRKLISNGTSHEELRGRIEQEPSLRALNAPNAYDKVSFDDFVLFSRSAKTVALELCDAGRPPDLELASLAAQQTAELEGRLRKNPARLANARSGFLQTTYSLTKSEADKIIETCQLNGRASPSTSRYPWMSAREGGG